MPPLPPLRLGLVGYGGFGRFLHQAWAALDGVTVTVVADPAPAVRPEGPALVGSWEALVGRTDVDLVVVATPPDTHAAVALAALDAGQHVLVEKPLATTRADAERIAAAAERTGLVVAVDYLQRFAPVAEALTAWARAGAFGPLRRVVVENYAQDEALPRAHWFWDPARSGGILVEHAVHFLDLVHALTDARAVRVHGEAVERLDGRRDRVLLDAVYSDGLAVTHYHSFDRPTFFERTTLRFVFALAEVHAEGWIPLAGRARALVTPATERALAALPGWTESGRAPVAGGAVTVGGRTYPAAHDVEGTFAVAAPKGQVYADALRALLQDVRRAVHVPGHRLRAGLPEGLASLNVALRATATARAVPEG